MTRMSGDQPSFIRTQTIFFHTQFVQHDNCLGKANKIAILFHYVNDTASAQCNNFPDVVKPTIYTLQQSSGGGHTKIKWGDDINLILILIIGISIVLPLFCQ